MFFCRGARTSAAALDQAFKSSSGLLLQVRVKANRLGYVPRTLRHNDALQCSRTLCLSTDSTGRREKDFFTVENGDSSTSSHLILHSGYFGRVTTIALNLSKSQQSVNSDVYCNSTSPFQANACQRRQVETFESVLFTGGGEVCAPRWHITTMQTRPASTAAAAQKRQTDAVETSADNKGCCIDNYEEMVKILLGRGASVNAQDNELWTPLHAAATCGHADLVKILITHGADLLAVNSDGNMPYDLCEDDPTLDIIETAMANRGITQEMINETRASTERRMLGDIQELLRGGEEVNQQDSMGATLLHIAAASGYVQAAELLLEGGACMDLRDSDGWQPLHAAACWGQMHVAELLVSHGASLNAKTHLEETPIDLCEDEEFRAILLDLKHKHDIIMKSQLKHKTSLCRRTSSAGSRGKVVRRASLSDRHNLCRKEYETEAIVWRGGREEQEEREKESDQETSQVVDIKPVVAVAAAESDRPTLPTILKEGSNKQNGLVSTATSTPLQPPTNGSTPSSDRGVVITTQPTNEEPWPRERAQTLSELKKQRSAAKLLNHPLFNGHLGNGSMDSSIDMKPSPDDPRMPLVSSNGSAVYYTPASGDPPILKLKQPIEVEQPKTQTCCCVS